MACPKAVHPLVSQRAYCGLDREPVVERLAHAHENDIAKVRIVSLSNDPLCPPDLHENFGDRELAHHAHLGGHAELALSTAAHLA